MFRCQRPEQSPGVRPRGCCKWAMGSWVPWKNSFSERPRVQESEGGTIMTMVEQGYDPPGGYTGKTLF